MFFEAKCTRLVYRVICTDVKGRVSRTGFFHDPNAAQDYLRLCELHSDVTEARLDTVRMNFDGWRVIA